MEHSSIHEDQAEDNSDQIEIISCESFDWFADEPAAVNYSALGKALAMCPDLFKNPRGIGLLRVTRPSCDVQEITKADVLWPLVVDRLNPRVIREGKPCGQIIAAQHLNGMLRADVFRDHFLPVDRILRQPAYLAGFQLAERGYNRSIDGQHVLYIGETPEIRSSTETIDRFLDVMQFASPADRTNAVAAALSAMLRNYWPGAKPLILVTGNKSHAGKDTILRFVTGDQRAVSISYEPTDWAVERSFVGAVKATQDIGVVVVENVRVYGKATQIASGFLERFITDPEPFLFSTGTGKPVRRPNDIVVGMSTNHGSVSEDLANRSLPIHLHATGNVADRNSPIGNPRWEYLPANMENIQAELRGMIERWKAAGMPRDTSVRHSFSEWAQVIGGILQISGYPGFLANYSWRSTVADPIREGLALLGSQRPGAWLRPRDYVVQVNDLGLAERLIPKADRASRKGQERRLGVILSAHDQETLECETDTERLKLRLEKQRGRFGESQPHCRYRFLVVERVPLAEAT